MQVSKFYFSVRVIVVIFLWFLFLWVCGCVGGKVIQSKVRQSETTKLDLTGW